MIDDIVNRLREVSCEKRWCGNEPHCRLCDAIDEIESLRIAVKVRDMQILANFKAMDAMYKELYGDNE